jgi:molybdate transport system substrate-binding protein
MRRGIRRAAGVVAAALLLTAARPAAADELLLFAAASLTDALRELGAAFERTTPDRVVFSFGASNDLARQIAAGAPADAFFSADVARMEELEAAGLVDRRDRRDVLSNALAVVVPAAATLAITEPADLKAVRRLAVANPDAVPAGVYAKRWLEGLGLWAAVEPHVVPTLDVRAALAAVEAERADAGIVYATDAATSAKVRVALRVPRAEGPPVVYPLAPLRTSAKPGTRALVRFLASRDAAPTWERHGFVVLAAG